MPRRLSPIFPGEIFLEEFLVPMRLSEVQLARGIGVTTRHFHGLVRGASNHVRHRLAAFFDTSIDLWINLQPGTIRNDPE